MGKWYRQKFAEWEVSGIDTPQGFFIFFPLELCFFHKFFFTHVRTKLIATADQETQRRLYQNHIRYTASNLW